jgi:nucleoside phosphorylase
MHQGTASAATLTTKLVLSYSPNFVAMLGHAAGNRNLASGLKVGDIMLAETSVDYDQVSILTRKMADGEQETIEKDRKHVITADGTLVDAIIQFATQTDILNKIKDGYPSEDLFTHSLNLKPGKLISGNALIRSEEWFQKMINENTGTIGLDMETHGFYYAAQNTVFKNKPLFISLKSVSDYGSERHDYNKAIKSHIIRINYATYTSANFLFHFAINCLPL